MKTLNKIMLASFLIGSMLTIGLFTQGETANNKVKNVNDTNEKPYISAGSDVSICNGSKVMLQGISTFTGGITIWKTNGDGSFNNFYNLNAIYTPGPHDIKIGKVALTLLYIAKTNTNQPIQDVMIVTFGNCSTDGDIKSR